MTTIQSSCHHCGSPLCALDALQGAPCRHAACRHLASEARWKGLRQDLGEPALRAAEVALQGAPLAPSIRRS